MTNYVCMYGVEAHYPSLQLLQKSLFNSNNQINFKFKPIHKDPIGQSKLSELLGNWTSNVIDLICCSQIAKKKVIINEWLLNLSLQLENFLPLVVKIYEMERRKSALPTNIPDNFFFCKEAKVTCNSLGKFNTRSGLPFASTIFLVFPICSVPIFSLPSCLLSGRC